MRNALHEQLLKAGLVDEKRLEEAERDKRRERAAPPGKHAVANAQAKKQRPPQRQGGAPQAARAPGPAGPSRSALEAARQSAQAARRELERDIVQLIKTNRQPHNDGEEVFNFVDGTKIGRIYVTPIMHGQLSRGELAIVRLRSRYAVVPTATAAGIAARAPEFVVVANQSSTSETLDPAYTEHPVPDDLRW